jgi:hypothetical protein
MNKAEAIIYHYGSGVVDFYVDAGDNIIWQDEEYPKPSDSDLKTWSDEAIVQNIINDESRRYLIDTDWMVIRHRDQIEQGTQTSLSDDEYKELLSNRQSKRDLIRG